MATTYNHTRLSVVDGDGNVNVMYPANTAEDVSVDKTANTNLPSTANSSQDVFDALGNAAFKQVSGEIVCYVESSEDIEFATSEINDSTTSTSSTWSSSKISTALDSKGNVKTLVFNNVSIPTSAWVTNTCTDFDSTERTDYPFMAEAALTGVLATDFGDALPSYKDQQSGILGNFATGNGKFIVEASERPTEAVVFTWIRIDRKL